MVVNDDATKNWIMSYYSARIRYLHFITWLPRHLCHSCYTAIILKIFFSSTDFWIGLFDHGTNDFIWADGTPSCLWASGDGTCDSKPFAPFQHDVSSGKKCIEWQNGQWRTDICSQTERFICQYKKGSAGKFSFNFFLQKGK